MAIKITKLNASKNENIRMLVFGQSGTKKTKFSVDGLKNAVVIDFEDGLGSTEDTDGVDVIKCNDAYEFGEAVEAILGSKYDTVVLDSLTEYSEKVFLALKSEYPDPSMAMPMWMKFDEILRTRHDQLMKMNKNVIVIALEETVAMESGYVSKYPSIKAKKFKEQLTAKYDIVAHASKDQEGKVIYDIIGSNSAVGKNRFFNQLKDEDISDTGSIQNFQQLIDTIVFKTSNN